MNEHPTPWRKQRSVINEGWVILDDDDHIVVTRLDELTADLIVRAVNAMPKILEIIEAKGNVTPAAALAEIKGIVEGADFPLAPPTDSV